MSWSSSYRKGSTRQPLYRIFLCGTRPCFYMYEGEGGFQNQLKKPVSYTHLDVYKRQILDNVTYQRCKLVRRYAKVLGIELVFLPSYSPNLNLIERFWKYVKKEVLYSTFHENYTTFKQNIDECINNAF